MIRIQYPTPRSLLPVSGALHVWLKDTQADDLDIQLSRVQVPSRLIRVYEVQTPDGTQIGWGFEPATPSYTVQSNALIVKLKNAPIISESAEFQHDYVVEDWHLFEWDNKYAILVVLPPEEKLQRLEP